MKTLTLDQFQNQLRAQGVSSHMHFCFRCPMCGKIQSATDLIKADAGKTFEEVQKYLAFSCVGRFLGAGSPDKKNPDSRGCNWTLGGLFKMHDLEVLVIEDGKEERFPRFEPTTPEEAQVHEKGNPA